MLCYSIDLGEGGFSHVYMVYKEGIGILAAKVIPYKEFSFSEFHVGFEHTKDGSNPFVLKYIESFQTGDFAVILMEYSNMK
ncbi:MAG: hypothetical protein EZS28_037358, partial [Streblomastix strix]